MTHSCVTCRPLLDAKDAENAGLRKDLYWSNNTLVTRTRQQEDWAAAEHKARRERDEALAEVDRLRAEASRAPRVAGRCPACRGASLFLGDGGHVTCSRLDCPDPVRVDDTLTAPVSSVEPEPPRATRHWLEAYVEQDQMAARLICEAPHACSETTEPGECAVIDWYDNSGFGDIVSFPLARNDVFGRVEVTVEWEGCDDETYCTLRPAPLTEVIDQAQPSCVFSPTCVGGCQESEQEQPRQSRVWTHGALDNPERPRVGENVAVCNASGRTWHQDGAVYRQAGRATHYYFWSLVEQFGPLTEVIDHAPTGQDGGDRG